MKFIRSKKWQHFSTRVPPVLAEKRFQLPTLTRGTGNRCSLIADHPRPADGPASRPRRSGGQPAACSGTRDPWIPDPGRPSRSSASEPEHGVAVLDRGAERLLDQGRGPRSAQARRAGRRGGSWFGVATTTDVASTPSLEQPAWSCERGSTAAADRHPRGVAAAEGSLQSAMVGSVTATTAGPGRWRNDVLDVLDAHHAAADDAVSERGHDSPRGRSLPAGKRLAAGG